MRTLLVSADFPPVVTGIGTVFSNIWRLLPPGDFEVLAPYSRGCSKVDEAYPLRVHRRLFPVGSSTLGRVLRAVLLLFYVGKLAFSLKVNLLICGSPVSIGFVGLVLKKLFGLPYLVFAYGGEVPKFRGSTLVSRTMETVLTNAQGIVVNSEYTLKEVKTFMDGHGRFLKLTPAVDAETFRPGSGGVRIRERHKLTGKKVLLTVARLVERKGHARLITNLPEIFKQVPDAAYLIVGSGPEEAHLREMSRNLGLEDKVVFAGRIADEELPAYYDACDLFVMLSRKITTDWRGEEPIEGFGTSFIEASACGKAVIGGRTGGVSDAVLDGMTGILVDPASDSEICDATVKLLRDGELAKRLGRSGRERVEKEFKWEDRAVKLQELLEDITEA